MNREKERVLISRREVKIIFDTKFNEIQQKQNKNVEKKEEEISSG